MTTFIIDDKSGACDSMWSDEYGFKVTVPLNKYLFIPTLEPFENTQALKIGAPKLLFYCGSYEQIVLHQAFSLNLLNTDQYSIYASNAVKLGFDSFGFIEVLLNNWEPIAYSNIENSLGVLFGGTGGNIANLHYKDNYSTVLAVEEAIKLDAHSDSPISHYHHTIDGEDFFENLDYTGNKVVQNIYYLASELIISMQTGERGGNMKDIQYSGCTTSAQQEAPAININNVVGSAKVAQRKILKRRRKPSTLKFRDDMNITPEKVQFKMIDV